MSAIVFKSRPIAPNVSPISFRATSRSASLPARATLRTSIISWKFSVTAAAGSSVSASSALGSPPPMRPCTSSSLMSFITSVICSIIIALAILSAAASFMPRTRCRLSIESPSNLRTHFPKRSSSFFFGAFPPYLTGLMAAPEASSSKSPPAFAMKSSSSSTASTVSESSSSPPPPFPDCLRVARAWSTSSMSIALTHWAMDSATLSFEIFPEATISSRSTASSTTYSSKRPGAKAARWDTSCLLKDCIAPSTDKMSSKSIGRSCLRLNRPSPAFFGRDGADFAAGGAGGDREEVCGASALGSAEGIALNLVISFPPNKSLNLAISSSITGFFGWTRFPRNE
mmetsp:Transcript_67035/g.135147  ORF Transcript_67035/g.135147 Transcript_67035/m.135147 type:complete len:342 (+) Transcript_67035:264-1289(+)